MLLHKYNNNLIYIDFIGSRERERERVETVKYLDKIGRVWVVIFPEDIC